MLGLTPIQLSTSIPRSCSSTALSPICSTAQRYAQSTTTGATNSLLVPGGAAGAIIIRIACARKHRHRTVRHARPAERQGSLNDRWRTDEQLEELVDKMKLPPRPRRLRVHRGTPGLGSPHAPTDEELEAMAEDIAPSPRRNVPDRFNPHTDDPLTKGMSIMCMKKNQMEHMICCRGCGIPLQTHDPTNVGYVRFAQYLRKWSNRLHRKMLCSRCLEIKRGLLRPVVKETLGSVENPSQHQQGFGGHVVPASVLTEQLRMIKYRRCLVVYIMDVLDFNGSYLRSLREIVGKNPLVAIGTKIDLLPPRTDLGAVSAWLRYALEKKRLRVLNVNLVSSLTGKGVSKATNAILEARRGLDTFVVGAANAGKSMFITQLLDQLELRFPQGRVEDCERPLVSSTPGTTLGTIALRAFRRSASSPVFACLYDTPGVHQPTSMQNLLPIELYGSVQPTKAFAVQNFCPGKDIIRTLQEAGDVLTSQVVKDMLDQPIRYLWGMPGKEPIVAVEVEPPISASLHISFIGVDGLSIQCQAGVPTNGGQPSAPDGMVLAQVCYAPVPQQLSLEGQVVTDVAISGFGWVAVAFKAVSAAAAGRTPAGKSQVALRVYGPRRLKVKSSPFPMPVGGLPGAVPKPPEKEKEVEQDHNERYEDEGEDTEDFPEEVLRNSGLPSGASAQQPAETQYTASAPERGDANEPVWARGLPRLQPMGALASQTGHDVISDDKDNADYFDPTMRRQAPASQSPMLDDDDFDPTLRRQAPSSQPTMLDDDDLDAESGFAGRMDMLEPEEEEEADDDVDVYEVGAAVQRQMYKQEEFDDPFGEFPGNDSIFSRKGYMAEDSFGNEPDVSRRRRPYQRHRNTGRAAHSELDEYNDARAYQRRSRSEEQEYGEKQDNRSSRPAIGRATGANAGIVRNIRRK